jgi:hypothetical protein
LSLIQPLFAPVDFFRPSMHARVNRLANGAGRKQLGICEVVIAHRGSDGARRTQAKLAEVGFFSWSRFCHMGRIAILPTSRAF